MHLAVGTSLTTIVATAASSTRAHYARGSIDTTLLRSWGPWLFIGAVLGMVVFSSINTASLSLIFGGVAALVAIYMLVSKEPETEDPDKFPKGFFRWMLGLFVGGESPFLGLAGGPPTVPFLSVFKNPFGAPLGPAAACAFLF